MNRFKKRAQEAPPRPAAATAVAEVGPSLTRGFTGLYIYTSTPPHTSPLIEPCAQAAAREGAENEEGEEEEDYMSEAFLANLEQQAASRTIGRKRPNPSSGSAPAPPLSRKGKQQQAEEKLQEGLKTPLPEVRVRVCSWVVGPDRWIGRSIHPSNEPTQPPPPPSAPQGNIGMRLLKLMGFGGAAGGPRGLGKAADGIAEPLAVTRRLGREGLGVTERKQRRAARHEELARLRAEWAERRKADFSKAMSDRFAERRVAGQLVRAMKTVETLDERAGRPRSRLWWSSEQGGVGDEGEGGGVAGRSGVVEGVDDGQAAAGAGVGVKPSVGTAEAGDAAPKTAGEGAGGDEEEEAAEDDDDLWPSLTNAEKLSIVLAYLRSEHSYCLWCGHQYEGAEELAAECPGEAEEEH